jgi:hypothetical protein
LKLKPLRTAHPDFKIQLKSILDRYAQEPRGEAPGFWFEIDPRPVNPRSKRPGCYVVSIYKDEDQTVKNRFPALPFDQNPPGVVFPKGLYIVSPHNYTIVEDPHGEEMYVDWQMLEDNLQQAREEWQELIDEYR